MQSLGAIMQQAITWVNVDPDLCHYMSSQRNNELYKGILKAVFMISGSF